MAPAGKSILLLLCLTFLFQTGFSDDTISHLNWKDIELPKPWTAFIDKHLVLSLTGHPSRTRSLKFLFCILEFQSYIFKLVSAKEIVFCKMILYPNGNKRIEITAPTSKTILTFRIVLCQCLIPQYLLQSGIFSFTGG